MPLFRSGPEIRSERILKLRSSSSKFYFYIDFLLLSIIFLSSLRKKTFFLTLSKHVLRMQMAQRKFSTSIAREPPPTLPDSRDEFKFASLIPAPSEIRTWHACI